MSFPRHQKYKESGVEWLGNIPAHWDVKLVKNLASIVNGYPFDSTLFDTSVGSPLIRIRDLNKSETETFYKGSFVEAAAITSDDVLIGMDGDFNVGRWRGYGRALLNQRMCCVRGKSKVLTRLLEYALPIRLKAINDLTYATTVKHLASSQVEKTHVAISPDVSEQTIIVAFLDQETAKIDALVAEQHRLKELLKEKRQAVISHAVTKGLNPNAPMKSSGIEWLGDVPAHWKISAIKRFTETITDGAHISPETENGVHPFVSTKDVNDDSIDFENCLRTSESSFDYMVKTGCRPVIGDVLFSKDGTIGRTIVVREDCEFVVASSLIIMRPAKNELNSNFLNYLCQSKLIISQVECFVKGAGLPRLSIQNLLKVIGCFPPLAEQISIAAYIHDKLSKFDNLVAEAQRAIDLLQERRTALISAAVTGQIDVRPLLKKEAA